MKIRTICLTMIATITVTIFPMSLKALQHSSSSQTDDVNELGISLGDDFKWDESLDYYLRKLKDPDPFTRVKAVQALGEIRDPISLEALLQQLRDENVYVRTYAIEALAKIGQKDARTVPKLLSTLNDREPCVRAMSARALGGLRSAAATDALRGLLSDEDEMVRNLAKWALKQITQPAK